MSVVIDTSNFTSYTRELSRLSGTSLMTVMLGEVAKVLERAIELTTQANFEKIKRSVEFKNRTLPATGETYGKHTPIIYVTKSGVIWFYDDVGPYGGRAKGPRNVGKSKTFHPMTEFFRYSDTRWGKYKGFLEQLKAKQIVVKDVLGRAGQSWLQCAQALGVDGEVNCPAYVRNAPPFKKSYFNGTGAKGTTATGIFVEIRNNAPILLGTMNGAAILQKAINLRYGNFLNKVRYATFEDFAKAAKAYPSFFVR